MSHEEQARINLRFTWAYRVIFGGLVSIITYFVLDIHKDFKNEIVRTNQLENRMGIAETQIYFLTQNNKP